MLLGFPEDLTFFHFADILEPCFHKFACFVQVPRNLGHVIGVFEVNQVRGLDAIDDSPVLDIKPYPDWEKSRWIIVTDFRAPKWLMEIIK